MTRDQLGSVDPAGNLGPAQGSGHGGIILREGAEQFSEVGVVAAWEAGCRMLDTNHEQR